MEATAEKPAAKEMTKAHQWTDGGEKVLILRRCNPDMTSHNGFTWPQSGLVAFSDFNSQPKCGGGGHGWPWGMGLGEGADYDLIGDKWLVIAAIPQNVVGELEGGSKCKVSECEVVYCGAFAGAWALVNSGRHRLIEAMARSGENTSSGDFSKAASSGNSSTAASSGNSSKAASSGNSSTAASSGDFSTAASSGNSSKASAEGSDTIACVAGGDGAVKVGLRGAFAIPYWTKEDGWRFICGKPGENEIKADTWYRINGGKLVEA